MSFNRMRYSLRLISFVVLVLFASRARLTAQAERSKAGVREIVLHNFGGADGDAPEFSPIADGTGALYVGTLFGGTLGCGTVLKMTPKGSGYDETVLHNFDCSDGQGVWGIAEDVQG